MYIIEILIEWYDY